MFSSNVEHGGEVLILTGTPGSGKTTVSRIISQLSGSGKVHLHTDDFWHFIQHGAVPPYLPEAHKQNKVVMEVLVGSAEAYARGGYFVIVDGIIGSWFLDLFKQISVPLHYIILQPMLEIAIKRCQERGGKSLSDPDVITSIHQQLFQSETLKKHWIPLNDEGAADIVDYVLEHVRLGKARLK